MKSLTIYQDHFIDSTSVSNQFIDVYMKDANDAQIKVYLYLLRMLGSQLTTSISEMADKFNHTEKDILRALKYWEKNKLLTLDYDASKNITGIHLMNLNQQAAATPVSAAVAEIVPISTTALTQETLPAQIDEPAAVEDKPASSDSKEALYPKPSYSLDELKAFKASEETAQLLFIVEQYIGRPLSASDMRTVLFICDKLHFSVDLVDYLVQYCVGRGKKDFRYIEKVALSWAEDHITTTKQAASLMKKHDKNVYGIMNALGKSGAPTDKEMEFINRWNKQFKFPADVIKEACDRTVLATDKHRFEYADSILCNWNKANIRHISDVRAADELYQKSKSSQACTASRPSGNKFNQFQQNDYDFATLEQELLSN